MSITISGYTFEGPFKSTGSLKDKSGVYCVLTRSSTNSNYQLIDVGESKNVKTRVEDHDRASCWERNKQADGLSYAAYYTSESDRMKIEKKIRNEYAPLPCGEK